MTNPKNPHIQPILDYIEQAVRDAFRAPAESRLEASADSDFHAARRFLVCFASGQPDADSASDGYREAVVAADPFCRMVLSAITLLEWTQFALNQLNSGLRVEVQPTNHLGAGNFSWRLAITADGYVVLQDFTPTWPEDLLRALLALAVAPPNVCAGPDAGRILDEIASNFGITVGTNPDTTLTPWRQCIEQAAVKSYRS